MKRKEIKRICVSSVHLNWLALTWLQLTWTRVGWTEVLTCIDGLNELQKQSVAVPKVATYLWPKQPRCRLPAGHANAHAPTPLALIVSVHTMCLWICKCICAFVPEFGFNPNFEKIENRPPPPEIWGWGSFQFGLLWWLQTVVRQILCWTAAHHHCKAVIWDFRQGMRLESGMLRPHNAWNMSRDHAKDWPIDWSDR